MKIKFYTPLNTAKKLKEAGYPQEGSDKYYTPAGALHDRAALDEQFKEELPVILIDCYAAPAYCEVLDWMESRGIAIISTNAVDTMRGLRWYCDIIEKSKKTRTNYYPMREVAIVSAIIGVLEDML